MKISEEIGFCSAKYVIERNDGEYNTGEREVLSCVDFNSNGEEFKRGLNKLFNYVKDMGEYVNTLTENKYNLPYPIVDDTIQRISIYPDGGVETFGIALTFLMTDIMSLRKYDTYI